MDLFSFLRLFELKGGTCIVTGAHPPLEAGVRILLPETRVLQAEGCIRLARLLAQFPTRFHCRRRVQGGVVRQRPDIAALHVELTYARLCGNCCTWAVPEVLCFG